MNIFKWYRRQPEIQNRLKNLAEEIQYLKLENSALQLENDEMSIRISEHEKDKQKFREKCKEEFRERVGQLNKAHAEKEAELENDKVDAGQKAHHFKQLVDHLEGEIYRRQKEKEDFKLQLNATIHDLQTRLDKEILECKGLKLKKDELVQKIADVNLYMMDEKDVEGRPFARIAPLLDKEGYEDLKKGKGRMKFKLVFPDGKIKVVEVLKSP